MSDIPSKFKDVSALVEAYECLEKDYTRKCQQLNKLKKAARHEVDTVEVRSVKIIPCNLIHLSNDADAIVKDVKTLMLKELVHAYPDSQDIVIHFDVTDDVKLVERHVRLSAEVIL